MSKQDFLNFELLEDIMDLENDKKSEFLKDKQIFRISPLVELAYQSTLDLEVNLNNLSENSITKQFLSIHKSKFSTLPNITSLKSREFEFIKTPETEKDIDDVRWESFLSRVKNAGIKAGLEESFSGALSATLGELVENIILHSEKSITGIAGYQWKANEFEYVVADSGIGVMNSFRQNPDYQWIKDSSQALKTTIKNGETRFGKGERHGTGFNLLLNIAKNNSYLRFRSGNHSLILNGNNAEEVGSISEETFVCSNFSGLLISLTCQVPNP